MELKPLLSNLLSGGIAMKHKGTVIISIAFMILGILFIVVGSMLGGSTSLFITNSGIYFENPNEIEMIQEEISDEINTIHIDVDYIEGIEISTSDEVNVFSIEYDKTSTELEISDGTLKVIKPSAEFNNNSEVTYISFDFGSIFNGGINNSSRYITINIPSNMNIEDLKISCKSGDIDLNNVIVNDELIVNNSYGDIKIIDVISDSISVQSDNSDLELDIVIADQIEIYKNYGSTEIDSLEADTLVIEQLSDDITLTGVDLQSGGDIISSYSEIEISVINHESEHTINVMSEYGQFEVNGQRLAVPTVIGTGNVMLNLTTVSGDIDLTFDNNI